MVAAFFGAIFAGCWWKSGFLIAGLTFLVAGGMAIWCFIAVYLAMK
jgi:hypothetical protein